MSSFDKYLIKKYGDILGEDAHLKKDGLYYFMIILNTIFSWCGFFGSVFIHYFTKYKN